MTGWLFLNELERIFGLREWRLHYEVYGHSEGVHRGKEKVGMQSSYYEYAKVCSMPRYPCLHRPNSSTPDCLSQPYPCRELNPTKSILSRFGLIHHMYFPTRPKRIRLSLRESFARDLKPTQVSATFPGIEIIAPHAFDSPV